MPTREAELYERWVQWRGRTARAIEAVDSMEEAEPSNGAPIEVEIPEDYGCREEEDAIAAMVMLNGDTCVHEKPHQ